MKHGTTEVAEGSANTSSQNRLALTTVRVRDKRYTFPSVIVRNSIKTDDNTDANRDVCVMLDVGLFCPFCEKSYKSRFSHRKSRVVLRKEVNLQAERPTDNDRDVLTSLTNPRESKNTSIYPEPAVLTLHALDPEKRRKEYVKSQENENEISSEELEQEDGVGQVMSSSSEGIGSKVCDSRPTQSLFRGTGVAGAAATRVEAVKIDASNQLSKRLIEKHNSPSRRNDQTDRCADALRSNAQSNAENICADKSDEITAVPDGEQTGESSQVVNVGESGANRPTAPATSAQNKQIDRKQNDNKNIIDDVDPCCVNRNEFVKDQPFSSSNPFPLAMKEVAKSEDYLHKSGLNKHAEQSALSGIGSGIADFADLEASEQMFSQPINTKGDEALVQGNKSLTESTLSEHRTNSRVNNRGVSAKCWAEKEYLQQPEVNSDQSQCSDNPLASTTKANHDTRALTPRQSRVRSESPETVMEKALDDVSSETETFAGDATLPRVFSVSREKSHEIKSKTTRTVTSTVAAGMSTTTSTHSLTSYPDVKSSLTQCSVRAAIESSLSRSVRKFSSSFRSFKVKEPDEIFEDYFESVMASIEQSSDDCATFDGSDVIDTIGIASNAASEDDQNYWTSDYESEALNSTMTSAFTRSFDDVTNRVTPSLRMTPKLGSRDLVMDDWTQEKEAEAKHVERIIDATQRMTQNLNVSDDFNKHEERLENNEEKSKNLGPLEDDAPQIHSPTEVFAPLSPNVYPDPMGVATLQKLPLLTSQNDLDTSLTSSVTEDLADQSFDQAEYNLSQNEIFVRNTGEDAFDPLLSAYVESQVRTARRAEEDASFIKTCDRRPSLGALSESSVTSSIDEFIPEVEQSNAPPQQLAQVYSAAVEVAKMFEQHHRTHPCFHKILEEAQREDGDDVSDACNSVEVETETKMAEFEHDEALTHAHATQFLSHIFGTQHSQHKKQRDDLRSCIRQLCATCEEDSSDGVKEDDVIVKSEEVTTEEVTLVFAWPKSRSRNNALVTSTNKLPVREINVHRVIRASDIDVKLVEGPQIYSQSVQAPPSPKVGALSPSASTNIHNKRYGTDAQELQNITLDLNVKVTKVQVDHERRESGVTSQALVRQTEAEQTAVDTITSNVLKIFAPTNIGVRDGMAGSSERQEAIEQSEEVSKELLRIANNCRAADKTPNSPQEEKELRSNEEVTSANRKEGVEIGTSEVFFDETNKHVTRESRHTKEGAKEGESDKVALFQEIRTKSGRSDCFDLTMLCNQQQQCFDVTRSHDTRTHFASATTSPTLGTTAVKQNTAESRHPASSELSTRAARHSSPQNSKQKHQETVCCDTKSEESERISSDCQVPVKGDTRLRSDTVKEQVKNSDSKVDCEKPKVTNSARNSLQVKNSSFHEDGLSTAGSGKKLFVMCVCCNCVFSNPSIPLYMSCIDM